MKSDLNVVVLPQPGNCGEDMNWIKWMVIGHSNPAAMNKSLLDSHVKNFTEMWAAMDPEEMEEDPGLTDEEFEEQFNAYQSGGSQAFLDFMDELGYVVFPPTSLVWCTTN